MKVNFEKSRYYVCRNCQSIIILTEAANKLLIESYFESAEILQTKILNKIALCCEEPDVTWASEIAYYNIYDLAKALGGPKDVV